MSRCGKCSADNPDAAVFCRICGHPLGSAVVCYICGAVNPPDGQYCIRCGRPLPSDAALGGDGGKQPRALVPYESDVPDLSTLELLESSSESIIGDERVDWNEIERLVGGLVDEAIARGEFRLGGSAAGYSRDAAQADHGIAVASCVAGVGSGPARSLAMANRARLDLAEVAARLSEVLDTPPAGTKVAKSRPAWQ